MFAGAVDGVVGFPVVASVSNAIKPGTIDTVCDSQYQLGELLGMSLPGAGAIKAGGTVVGAIGAKVVSKPLAGIYKVLDKAYKGRKGVQDVNHIPSHDWHSKMKTGYETPGRSSNRPSIIMDKADHKIFSTSKRGHVDAYKAQGFTDSSYTRDVVIIELKEMLSSKIPQRKVYPSC